jgi:hypothetical protein
MKIKLGFGAALLCLTMQTFLVSSAHAGAVLQYGDTILGINNEGHLNFVPSSDDLTAPDGFEGAMEGSDFFGSNPDDIPFGLWRNGVGDSTSPGCLCEGWGIAFNSSGERIGAEASVDSGGISGIDDGVFGSTDQTATSTVNLTDADVSVTHAFGPSLALGVFQASVTISNNTGGTIDDLVYRRAMDWDIPPDEFNEFVTHGGVEANLEVNGGNVRYASDNGFANLDPRSDAGYINSETVNVDFEDNGPTDHGSVFDFAFGELASGESRTFNIFYGSTANEADAMTALNTLGVDVYSLGQYSGGAEPFGGGECDGPCGPFDDGGCDGPCPTISESPSAFAATLSVDLEDDEIGGPVSGEPATFLFAFGGVGGVEPGETAEVPVLPFVTAPGEFVFVSPEPARWFDPPFADGFDYELEGGALFTSITMPAASFGFGDADVVVGGVVVGSIVSGGSFDLSSFSTSKFSLVGLDMTLDTAAADFATAFPLFIDWDGTATVLNQSAILVTGDPVDVSAPGTVAFLPFGLLVFAFFRKRKKISTF